MLRAFLLTLVLVAAPAAAQIAPPSAVKTVSIPFVIQTGSVEYGPDVTAGGSSSIVPGFSFDSISRSGNRARYLRLDASGGMAVVACLVYACSGLTEERSGVETGSDGWVYLEGVLIPSAEGGVMFNTPVGSLGGGVAAGSVGITGGADTFGYGMAGLQGAYGAQFGPVTVLALGTYGVGYGYATGEGGLTGRITKLRTDAYFPVGGINLIGTFSIVRATDTLGTEDVSDDLDGTFVTFGTGIGF
ncbi:MAG: hypothetical protein AAGI91_09365 [Bacteroidota bacterium]